MSLADFTASYIECALWSSTDNSDESGGEPLDQNYGPENILKATRKEMEADCEAFYEAHAATWQAVGHTDDQAGHDFWLNRNGHGAGFWDRGLGAVGEELSKACRVYGGVDLHVYRGKVRS